jgi:DNA adenine methylase
LRPLLKWAGGKRSLVERIVGLFPEDITGRSFHEPFFGGGAVFFHVEPGSGSINDINPKLMNFYRVVRDDPAALIEEASKYRYEEEEFYEHRSKFNSPGLSDVEYAAILLYLNKTAYNGLYRGTTTSWRWLRKIASAIWTPRTTRRVRLRTLPTTR